MWMPVARGCLSHAFSSSPLSGPPHSKPCTRLLGLCYCILCWEVRTFKVFYSADGFFADYHGIIVGFFQRGGQILKCASRTGLVYIFVTAAITPFKFIFWRDHCDLQIIYQVILEDLEMLQVKPDMFTHTSQYFDLMLEYCERLLREGKAYVDNTDPETMKTEREQRVQSKNWNNS